MIGSKTEDNTELLTQILKEMRELKTEVQELKADKERNLWALSIEQSLFKTWNNEADEESNSLM